MSLCKAVSSRSCQGFTLIEMSIVLIVISLILAGVLKTVGVQRQQLKRDETRQQLETIKEAIIGFVLTNGRLPCPDNDTDGVEDPQNPANQEDCDVNEGWLPHMDIGAGNVDTWGSRFRYRIRGSGNLSMADAPPALDGAGNIKTNASGEQIGAIASFDMTDDGNITIDDEAGNTIASNVPAVVISFAENARTTIANCAGVSAREQENCNGDTTFISSFYSNVTNQEFDDLVIWIPLTVLKTRMIEAARLP